jgi:PAS domain S-box-containing protein
MRLVHRQRSSAEHATTARLFGKYALILLVPVLVLGVGLAIGMRSEAQRRGLDEGIAEAKLIDETAIEPLLDGRPLSAHLSPSERTGLERIVIRAVRTKDILRLRLHDLRGDVVFSDDGSGFGGRRDEEALAAAHGNVTARLTHENSDSDDVGPIGPTAVEVYQPLLAGPARRRVGVLELYLPYAPINADVSAGMHALYLDLIAGLTMLYLALLALTASVSRGLRRQVALNVAQAEKLRVSVAEHRKLFEENPLPMFAYDRATLQIVAVSNVAVANYGYSREEFLEMPISGIHPPADVPSLLRQLEIDDGRMRGGYSGPRQARHQYNDGTMIDVEISGDDVAFGGRACRIVLCQDVTERIKATEELAVARDAAIEASNTKSAFLANVSHEIRTPMNGVLGMNELLRSTTLDDEQRRYADQVASSGEHMLAIINDILDVAKIETGQLELDATDFALPDALEQACEPSAVEALSKGVQFKLDIDADVPRRVHGDGGRLRQIVLNLVTNAVKFTSEGAVTVKVNMLGAPAEMLRLRIAVADEGIGIAPERIEQMFEPFTQADVSTTRRYGGTGLGLAIARELTELMGGAIGAESEPGVGSTFWVELELGRAVEAGASSDAAPIASDPQVAVELAADAPIVLIADDTPVNQIVAARAAQRCGCRSHVVNDGYEVLDALIEQRYDAILMDCQMPEMDGYETTVELRRREAGGKRTPVIAMTASAMKSDFERCMSHGMDDFISKPLRHHALDEVLRRWIPRLGASDSDQPNAAAA